VKPVNNAPVNLSNWNDEYRYKLLGLKTSNAENKIHSIQRRLSSALM
jgi:hypothetical protein